MAVDAMGAFSGILKEVETIVGLKVNKVINRMKLVKRDEFEVLKKLVQKLLMENQKLKKNKSTKNKNLKPSKKTLIKKRVKK